MVITLSCALCLTFFMQVIASCLNCEHHQCVARMICCVYFVFLYYFYSQRYQPFHEILLWLHRVEEMLISLLPGCAHKTLTSLILIVMTSVWTQHLEYRTWQLHVASVPAFLLLWVKAKPIHSKVLLLLVPLQLQTSVGRLVPVLHYPSVSHHHLVLSLYASYSKTSKQRTLWEQAFCPL